MNKILALLILTGISANASAFWEVRDNTPTTAQVTYEYKFNKTVAGVLLINFMPEMNCMPEVSLMIIGGDAMHLGTPKGQAWAKDKMSIWVDNKLVWNDRTAATMYSNATETGGLATSHLIEKLKRGNTVAAQQLPGLPKFVFSLKGSSAAIDQARKNCH